MSAFRWRVRAIPFWLIVVFVAGACSAQVIPGGALGRGDAPTTAGTVLLTDEELFGSGAVSDIDSAPPQSRADVSVSGTDSGVVAAPAPAASDAAPRSISVLCARPVSFGFSVDKKLTWIAPLVELYFSLRMSSYPQVHVVAPDIAGGTLAGYRDYSSRIAKQKMRDLGQRLGATHVVYAEYEVQSVKTVKLHIAVVTADGRESRIAAILELDNLDKTLAECAAQVASALSIAPGSEPADIKTSLLGSDSKRIQRLGAALAWDGAPQAQKAATAAQQCRTLYQADGSMLLAGYAAAIMSAEAGAWELALSDMKKLVDTRGGAYAGLALEAARFARKAGRESEAREMLARVPESAAYASGVAFERAALSEKAGRHDEALGEYDAILTGVEHAAALERRVMMMILLRKGESEIIEAARRAATSLQTTPLDILSRAAEELAGAGSLEPAVTAYSACARVAPENADVLVKLASLYEQQGSSEQAARVYEGLVELNPTAYRPLLDRAAAIYTKLSQLDKAVHVYESYLGMRDDPEATVSMARLLFATGDCARVRQVLKGVQQQYYASAALDSLLAACGKDTTAPRITLRGSTVTIQTGQVWQDPGAQALDDQDGDITAFIKTSSTIDIAYPGTYEVTYSVRDRAGNAAIERRTVIVEGKARPELAALAKSDKRRPVRLAFSIAGGVLAAGSFAAGVIVDSRIESLQTRYDQSRDYDEVAGLHGDMEDAAMVRSALYAAAGVCAAGFTLTVTIPSARRAKAHNALAMNEVQR